MRAAGAPVAASSQAPPTASRSVPGGSEGMAVKYRHRPRGVQFGVSVRTAGGRGFSRERGILARFARTLDGVSRAFAWLQSLTLVQATLFALLENTLLLLA